MRVGNKRTLVRWLRVEGVHHSDGIGGVSLGELRCKIVSVVFALRVEWQHTELATDITSAGGEGEFGVPMWKMFVKEDRADCATLTASFPISKPIDMSSGVEARDAAYND